MRFILKSYDVIPFMLWCKVNGIKNCYNCNRVSVSSSGNLRPVCVYVSLKFTTVKKDKYLTD